MVLDSREYRVSDDTRLSSPYLTQLCNQTLTLTQPAVNPTFREHLAFSTFSLRTSGLPFAFPQWGSNWVQSQWFKPVSWRSSAKIRAWLWKAIINNVSQLLFRLIIRYNSLWRAQAGCRLPFHKRERICFASNSLPSVQSCTVRRRFRHHEPALMLGCHSQEVNPQAEVRKGSHWIEEPSFQTRSKWLLQAQVASAVTAANGFQSRGKIGNVLLGCLEGKRLFSYFYPFLDRLILSFSLPSI